jgi:hypothetical protein
MAPDCTSHGWVVSRAWTQPARCGIDSVKTIVDQLNPLADPAGMRIRGGIVGSLLLALTVTVGCSRSSASCAAACQSSARADSLEAPTPSSASRTSAEALTGFGATRADWDAHHQADPDPHLDSGCCYGPPVDDPDNGGTADTWNLAGNGDKPGDRIVMVTHTFEPQTSEAEVISEVEREDLPADAVQVDEHLHDVCKTFVYTSSTLGMVGRPDTGSSIGVVLYSSLNQQALDSGPYDPSNIVQAMESIGTDADTDC